jgi:5-methyltetrahydropteroyltriglutamate--homocysteine methyltransferase
MKLLHTFKQYGYSNQIGPGVYDIHSPRIPPGQEIEERLKAMLAILPSSLLFVNPDCGLKTRGWKETEGKLFVLHQLTAALILFRTASLNNLVSAAKWARENYA